MGSAIEGSGIQGSGYVGQAGKEQVKRLSGATRERVYHRADDRKEEFIKGLHDLAGTLEDAGREGNLGPAKRLVDGAVQLIHRVSDRLERGSTEELVRDAQARIRQRPGLFIAGCVALGFFAGRLLKI